MVLEFDFAKEPQVLPPDSEVAPTEAEQNSLIEEARKLYGDTAPSVGHILTERGSGSGFFISDDAMITDAHVVQSTTRHRVLATDGKLYPARIEKLDDVNDLALLRLEGVEKGEYKPLRLQSTSSVDSNVFALGHPEGRYLVHISPGRVESIGTQLEFGCDTRLGEKREEFREMLNRMDGVLGEMADLLGKKHEEKKLPTCEEEWQQKVEELPVGDQADAQVWLDRPNIHGLVNIRGGNSGGPLVDSTGSVVGVARMNEIMDPASSSFTPVEVVQDFLRTPETKFSFEYGYENTSRLANTLYRKPVTSGITAVAGTGAAAVGARFLPRISAVGAIGYGGWSLLSDVSERQTLNGDREIFQNTVAIGSDVATMGGGILSLAARRFRWVGLAVAGAGIASRLGSELIPTDLRLKSIQRQDGGTRPPFSSKLLGTQ